MINEQILVQNADGVYVSINWHDATKEQLLEIIKREHLAKSSYEAGLEAGLVIAQRLAAAGAGKVARPHEFGE